ncbi:unnamed protein product [Symbiodinium natans]|uniref:Uncharacterized protein n=1 Tax=Symbiodinium natans TaxID=878477 RepID=A0A812S2I1_9DINO|nr:unnamed protein product [Symbiodinium natans]
MVHEEAFDLALAVQRRLEVEPTSLAHIMVEPGGGLRFFTKEHVLAQAARGKVLCKGCGFFFGEGNPMRTHVQNATDTRCFSVEATEYYLRPCQDETSPSAPSCAAKKPESSSIDPGLDAAQRGDLLALQALVERGWDANKATDHRGNGALHWAAGGGHVEVCEYLLRELGMDARGRTSKHHGRTALHWAARNGHTAVCELLLHLNRTTFGSSRVDTHSGTVIQ